MEILHYDIGINDSTEVFEDMSLIHGTADIEFPHYPSPFEIAQAIALTLLEVAKEFNLEDLKKKHPSAKVNLLEKNFWGRGTWTDQPPEIWIDWNITGESDEETRAIMMDYFGWQTLLEPHSCGQTIVKVNYASGSNVVESMICKGCGADLR